MITVEQVITILDEIVAEKGADYIYINDMGHKAGERPGDASALVEGTVCKYVHNNGDGTRSPGCIAGQVLYKLGVTLDKLSKFEGCRINGVLEEKVLPDKYQTGVRSMLLKAQMLQDEGYPYGAVVEKSKQISIVAS